MTRVIMADDHPLVREGLKHLLAACNDIEFADEVDNGNDLIARLREDKYDVVLMDMFMPGRNGVDLIKLIKSEYPRLPILVLSTHKEDIFAVRTLKAGASGYLCKDYAASSLVDAIRKVAEGGVFISPAVAELMAKDLQSPTQEVTPHTLLTDREFQVFLLVAQGQGSSEIAKELNLSIKTVSTHRARIKDKTKLTNTSEIIRYAIKHDLVSEDMDSTN